MGLKHGHVTQSGHGVTFPTLPADHDSYEYSVMTYQQFPDDSPSDGDSAPDHPTTYMQDDIAALQYMYGANYSFNNGARPTPGTPPPVRKALTASRRSTSMERPRQPTARFS